MNRTRIACFALLLAIGSAVPSPLMAQIFPSFGKGKGLPKISVVRDGLPALANPAYGEVMLSGNEALLEPAWLVGSLRDGATGQVLKWNNYLQPDAKPNVKLLTDTVFEGFVDSSAVGKTEWLSTLKLNAQEQTVAEVVVTRVSVTSVSPKEIDRTRLLQEIVQKLPPDQQNRYSVIIAYVDIAITSTRFQHYEVDGDVAGYGGRIGGDWYYKDKQKTTDHRLVAISAPLQFALTSFAPPNGGEKSLLENGPRLEINKPCYELVSDAIKQGTLPQEKTGLLSVWAGPQESCPIAIAAAAVSPGPSIAKIAKRDHMVVGNPSTGGATPGVEESNWAATRKFSHGFSTTGVQPGPAYDPQMPPAAMMPACPAPSVAPPPHP
jgi:hypothetical protein